MEIRKQYRVKRHRLGALAAATNVKRGSKETRDMCVDVLIIERKWDILSHLNEAARISDILWKKTLDKGWDDVNSAILKIRSDMLALDPQLDNPESTKNEPTSQRSMNQ